MTQPFNDPFSGPPGGDEDFEADLGEGQIEFSGDYIVALVDVGKDTSQQGNPMWVWDFVIVSDMQGNSVNSGYALRYYTALTAAAMWKASEVVVGLGLAKAGELARFKKADAIGRQASARIKMGEYQGRKRPEIELIGPHPAGPGYRPAGGVPGGPTAAPAAAAAPGPAPAPAAPPGASPVASPLPAGAAPGTPIPGAAPTSTGAQGTGPAPQAPAPEEEIPF